jgi:hypothetical protein
MYALFSVTGAALLWLGLKVAYTEPKFLLPYAVVFGAQRAIISISWIDPNAPAKSSVKRLFAAISAGISLALVQTSPLFFAMPHAALSQSLIVILGVCLASLPFYRLRNVGYSPAGSNRMVNLIGFCLALFASAIAAGLEMLC